MADVKADIAAEAVKIVSGARRSAYGKPEQNFERIARLWNTHIANTGRCLVKSSTVFGDRAPLTAIDVATFCRFIKEARLAETPAHRDSFVDVVGYALCQAELALPEATKHSVEDDDGRITPVHRRPGETMNAAIMRTVGFTAAEQRSLVDFAKQGAPPIVTNTSEDRMLRDAASRAQSIECGCAACKAYRAAADTRPSELA